MAVDNNKRHFFQWYQSIAYVNAYVAVYTQNNN